MKTDPEAFLRAIAPYRPDIVVAVACRFTWDWLADLCADEDIPVVLGHALSMQAIPGGKAQNDRIDSPKIAVLLRGGLLPQASVYPAEMRATRALWRRRRPLPHAWSRVPRSRTANAPGPRGAPSGMPISRGPVPQPPSSACGLIPQDRHA